MRGTAGIPLFFYPDLKWNFLSPVTLQRIISFKPDVIHFVDPILLGPQVILAARLFLPNVPRVSSYHTNIALYSKHFGYPFLSPVIWALQRSLHGQCELTMCPSPSTALSLADHGFSDSKMRIWHRGVDIELFSSSKRQSALRDTWGNKIILLYVGRISWEKNLRALAHAYINLNHDNVHLVITGDGPARAELESMLANEKRSVTFTGYLQGKVCANLIQAKI